MCYGRYRAKYVVFFFSSRRRHTRCSRDWSSDVCSSDLWERGEDAARLAALHRAIDACCGSLNLATDSRPLSVHLTLARVKAGERVVGQVLAQSGVMDRPFTCESLDINAIALMKSELKPSGSVYTRLWDVRL